MIFIAQVYFFFFYLFFGQIEYYKLRPLNIRTDYFHLLSEDKNSDSIDNNANIDLGLEDRLNQKVGVMSGGQRQALTLLMATIRNKPTHRTMKKDYIRFSEKDHDVAKREFEDFYNQNEIIVTKKL